MSLALLALLAATFGSNHIAVATVPVLGINVGNPQKRALLSPVVHGHLLMCHP